MARRELEKLEGLNMLNVFIYVCAEVQSWKIKNIYDKKSFITFR